MVVLWAHHYPCQLLIAKTASACARVDAAKAYRVSMCCGLCTLATSGHIINHRGQVSTQLFIETPCCLADASQSGRIHSR